jgi:hypothetical protein
VDCQRKIALIADAIVTVIPQASSGVRVFANVWPSRHRRSAAGAIDVAAQDGRQWQQ